MRSRQRAFRTISGYKGTRFLLLLLLPLPPHPPPILGFVVDTEQIEKQSSDVVSQGQLFENHLPMMRLRMKMYEVLTKM